MAPDDCETVDCAEPFAIPFARVAPEILRKMIEEFVTREWSEGGASEYPLDEKVRQVEQQLRDGRACIMYDPASETWNIIPHR